MMAGSETTSSELLESDNDQEVIQEESTETKRSYDCTFCKRGFTNARALGGHMNIHRKERTNKAKQSTQNSSVLSMASTFVPQVSSQPSMYYYILETPRSYEPSPTNPRNYPPMFQYDFLNTTSQSLIRNELLSTNLSLQISSSHQDADQVRRGIETYGDGVDLELRLGHHPYSNY